MKKIKNSGFGLLGLIAAIPVVIICGTAAASTIKFLVSNTIIEGIENDSNVQLAAAAEHVVRVGRLASLCEKIRLPSPNESKTILDCWVRFDNVTLPEFSNIRFEAPAPQSELRGLTVLHRSGNASDEIWVRHQIYELVQTFTLCDSTEMNALPPTCQLNEADGTGSFNQVGSRFFRFKLSSTNRVLQGRIERPLYSQQIHGAFSIRNVAAAGGANYLWGTYY